jgi:hypothetical protein
MSGSLELTRQEIYNLLNQQGKGKTLQQQKNNPQLKLL